MGTVVNQQGHHVKQDELRWRAVTTGWKQRADCREQMKCGVVLLNKAQQVAVLSHTCQN